MEAASSFTSALFEIFANFVLAIAFKKVIATEQKLPSVSTANGTIDALEWEPLYIYISYNNFASHGKYYHTNSYAQNILSLRFIFFLVQIKYSIDKNQLRLSGEEERNDKIKRKMTTALRILKKIKLLKNEN